MLEIATFLWGIALIDVYLKELNDFWFGLDCSGEKIVATALDSKKEGTLKNVIKNLPPNANYRLVEKKTEFAEKTIRELDEAHRGIRDFKDLDLATEYISEPRATVLKVAASIPIGYVASYGSIAKVANTDPRVVGQIMASNPLYPLVPCHRVVGTDFSLVGYGGRKSPQALRAKLSRLKTECKGFKQPKEIPVKNAIFTVHPTEQVVEKAKIQKFHISTRRQRTLAG